MMPGRQVAGVRRHLAPGGIRDAHACQRAVEGLIEEERRHRWVVRNDAVGRWVRLYQVRVRGGHARDQQPQRGCAEQAEQDGAVRQTRRSHGLDPRYLMLKLNALPALWPSSADVVNQITVYSPLSPLGSPTVISFGFLKGNWTLLGSTMAWSPLGSPSKTWH